MRDVQNLRELILGLAIITPVGCQSSPPAADIDLAVEQAQPRVDAAVDAAVESERRDDAMASAAKAVDTANRKGFWLAQQASSLAEQERQRKKRLEPCMTLDEVHTAQQSFYDRELALWKSQAALRKKVEKGELKMHPMHGPSLVSKPKAPRFGTSCPKTLITNISRSRCQTIVTKFNLKSREKSAEGDLVCCYVNPDGDRPRRVCGRLFYVGEEVTRAQTEANRGWMGADVERPPGVSEDLAMEAAEAWLEDALEEHASIAAFSRATLELMALGAPSELLAEYQRASLDEIEHARLCFSLVGALLGREVSAGALEVEGPRDDLDAIIADVFWGGCVGESVAALCAQRALAGGEWAPAKRALEVISEDEAKHAALAWSTLSFFGQVQPERLRRLLEGVQAPVTPPASVAPEREDERGWTALGRLTPAQESRAAQDAWAHLIAPMIDALLEG